MKEENPYAPPAGETKVTLDSEGEGEAELSPKVPDG
jgi:hypothetical protein